MGIRSCTPENAAGDGHRLRRLSRKTMESLTQAELVGTLLFVCVFIGLGVIARIIVMVRSRRRNADDD